MIDDERVSSWDVVRQSLVRMRDDRKADPGEIREYVAINALDALQALESQNQALLREVKTNSATLKAIEALLDVDDEHTGWERLRALRERAEKAERDLVTASENLSKLCDAVPMATLVSIRDTARRIGLSGLSLTQETDPE